VLNDDPGVIRYANGVVNNARYNGEREGMMINRTRCVLSLGLK